MFHRIALAFAFLLVASAVDAAEFTYRSGPRDMRVDVMTPDGAAPKALVLVLHTSGGFQQADAEYAKKLVAEGYATAIPHFLAAYGITAQQRRRTWSSFRAEIFADFGRIADEVAPRIKVDRARVYAVGFSNGGYWAAYLAGKGAIKGGVCYYGALTEAGNDRELDNLSRAIAERPAPVLFLHGTEDETVNVGAARRLQQRGPGERLSFVYYEGAGHRFERETGSANEKAAADAWKRTLAFLAAP